MKSLALAVLLSCAGLAAAQDILIRQYDRFENRTRYWTRPAYVAPDLNLTTSFSFRGKGAGNEIEGFHLVFTSVSTDWRYVKNARLMCLVDGKSIDLGRAEAADSDIQASYGSVEVKEILVFPIRYDTLRSLANSKSVEMRLGTTEFYLKEYVKSDIKELLSKVQIVQPLKANTRR